MEEWILTNSAPFAIIIRHVEVWLSLVERCVRDAKAAGSNPVTSTNKIPAEFFLCGFCFAVSFPYRPSPMFFLTLFMVLSAMASAFSAPSLRASTSSWEFLISWYLFLMGSREPFTTSTRSFLKSP